MLPPRPSQASTGEAPSEAGPSYSSGPGVHPLLDAEHEYLTYDDAYEEATSPRHKRGLEAGLNGEPPEEEEESREQLKVVFRVERMGVEMYDGVVGLASLVLKEACLELTVGGPEQGSSVCMTLGAVEVQPTTLSPILAQP